MNIIQTTRRTLLGGMAGVTMLGTARRAGAQAAPALPTSPISLNIIDVAGKPSAHAAGVRGLPQGQIEPGLGDQFHARRTAPELPGKLKAQQAANRVDIDMVLTGNDGLAAGIAQNLWVKLYPDYAGKLPDLSAILAAGCAEDAGAGAEPGRVRHATARADRCWSTCLTR